MTRNNGCSFGLVTREKIEENQKNITEINSKLDKMNDRITELFNHQSSRLPPWVTVVISGLSSFVTGLIMWIITHPAS